MLVTDDSPYEFVRLRTRQHFPRQPVADVEERTTN